MHNKKKRKNVRELHPFLLPHLRIDADPESWLPPGGTYEADLLSLPIVQTNDIVREFGPENLVIQAEVNMRYSFL